MAIAFNGSTQYLSGTSSAIGSSSPSAYTFSAWVKGAAQDAVNIFAFGNSADNSPWVRLLSGYSGYSQATSSLVFAIRNNAATHIVGTAAGDATGTCLDSTWHHILARWNGTNASWGVDGSIHTSGSLTPGTITLDRTAMAVLLRVGTSGFFTGSMANGGVWNVALNDDEWTSLAKGAAPRHVRPASLTCTMRGVNTSADHTGKLSLVATGSPTADDHPRTYV